MNNKIFKTFSVAVFLIMYLTAEAQEKQFGVTTISVVQHREMPDFSAELGNQILCGTVVKITDSQGYWKKVKSPEPYSAWCVDLAIKEMDAGELEEYMQLPKVICTAAHSNIMSGPSSKAQKICDIVQGNILILEERLSGKYVKVSLADGRTGYILRKDVENFRKWANGTTASAENIIETALGYLGIPYVWGGTSVNGMDCSGLTRMVWFMNGALLPRNASQQALAGNKVEVSSDTRRFPVENSANLCQEEGFRDEMLRRIENLKPGDLIFFGRPADNGGKDRISHVGIYLGEGKFIHASRYVRINSLIPGSENWYEGAGKFISARRVTEEEGMQDIPRISESYDYFRATEWISE